MADHDNNHDDETGDQPGEVDHSAKTLAAINRQHHARNFDRNKEPLGGEAVIQTVMSETGDTCLLSFSGGKDSLCAWITLRKHFKRIIPYHVYRIPHAGWVNDLLDRYEDIFETHIYRMPASNLYNMWRKYCFLPPNRWPHIEAANLQIFNWRDIEWLVKYQVGVPQETFTATGLRAVDNIQRRIAVMRYGPIHWGRKTFMPIWDFKKARVVDVLEQSGIPLSIEYEWFGRSLGGMDYRHLKPISENSPADWQRVLESFPLAWVELARYDDLTKDYPYGELGDG